MKSLVLALFPAALFLIFSCTSSQHIARDSSSANPRDLLEAVNRMRGNGCKCGGTVMPAVPPLKWNNKLASAAQNHSSYMNGRKKLIHAGNRNAGPGERITAAGYKWDFFAENIAAGQQTVAEVMDSWLKSPGHCKNIMNKNATEMAAGRSGTYWTLVFARPL